MAFYYGRETQLGRRLKVPRYMRLLESYYEQAERPSIQANALL